MKIYVAFPTDAAIVTDNGVSKSRDLMPTDS